MIFTSKPLYSTTQRQDTRPTHPYRVSNNTLSRTGRDRGMDLRMQPHIAPSCARAYNDPWENRAHNGVCARGGGCGEYVPLGDVDGEWRVATPSATDWRPMDATDTAVRD